MECWRCWAVPSRLEGPGVASCGYSKNLALAQKNLASCGYSKNLALAQKGVNQASNGIYSLDTGLPSLVNRPQ